MAQTIKLNYEETLKAARSMSSLQDLIADARNRSLQAQNHLSDCEGMAVSKAKQALCRLDKLYDELKGWDMQLALFLEKCASELTYTDEKAAQEIEASFGAGSTRSSGGDGGSGGGGGGFSGGGGGGGGGGGW